MNECEPENKEQKEKWFFKTWVLLAAFLTVGPFMLPLLWKKPGLSTKAKMVITAVVFILTYIITVFSINTFKSMFSYYDQALKQLPQM